MVFFFLLSWFKGGERTNEQKKNRQTDKRMDGWMEGQEVWRKGVCCCVFCYVYAKGCDGTRMAGLELELEMWSACPLNGNCVQHYAKMKKKPRKLSEWGKQAGRVGGEEAGGMDRDMDKDQSGGWTMVDGRWWTHWIGQ